MNRFERTVRRVITNSNLTDKQWLALIELCEKIETIPFIRGPYPRQVNSGDLSCIQVEVPEVVEVEEVKPTPAKKVVPKKKGKG